MKSKKLWAGPYVGEFGWELFHWQGWLRKLAKDYSEVHVACKPGHEILYADFATQVYHYPGIGSLTDCEKELHFQYNNAHTQLGIEFEKIILPWTTSHFMPIIDEQEFINFSPQLDLLKLPPRPIVIHARNTDKYRTGYRDWSSRKWEELIKLYKEDFTIVSIGTKDASHHIEGTVDMRGVPLGELSSIMKHASVLVGPSSGPMHFGSLCGTPHVSWGGPPRNKPRYEKDWNPLNTSVIFIEPNPGGTHADPKSWDASIKDVMKSMDNILQ